MTQTAFCFARDLARRDPWLGDAALELCRNAYARSISRRSDRFASRKSMPFALRLVRLGVVLVIAGVAAETARAQEKAAESTQTVGDSVFVVRAKKGCFLDKARVTGFLLPAQQAIVVLELEGYRVSEILAREGERVKDGQLIARVERVGAPPPEQRDMPATIALFAPIGGRVEKSTAQLGAVALPKWEKGEPLFRIVNDEIQMEAEVPSLYLSKIAPMQTVRIETPNGQVNGRVKRISSEVDKVTQMGHVRAILDNSSALHIGDFVQATIEAGQSCKNLAVPLSAVYHGADGTTVQVIRAQVVETHHVRIGLSNDQDAEITEGVHEGDVVVKYAGSSLRDGDQVTPNFNDDSGRTERR